MTLIVALFAFEVFNFDTTRYALRNLLGDVSFLRLEWAAILAVAFCAIDFAGLARIFTPEKGRDEPKEVWYLMGAWLLGATMNAVMTWWAVSLTLLSHDFGNEVLSRAQLLNYVPVFVAILVWLTRILFIGALSVAGDHLFDFGRDERAAARPVAQSQTVAQQPMQAATLTPTDRPRHRQRPLPESVYDDPPTLFLQREDLEDELVESVPAPAAIPQAGERMTPVRPRPQRRTRPATAPRTTFRPIPASMQTHIDE
jgi:hypothetical protein